MASIVEQLKQFAARLTTAAGDVSAVPGQSIAEVITFTRKNLNVDASGALLISELKMPSTGGGNLLQAPITHSEPIEDTAVLSLDFSVGIEDGKSYTIKGTHGIANTPFEVTAVADKASGGDFTDMLTDERQSLIVAQVNPAEGAGLDIIILDKIYLDFENEISEYNENKAMVLLANNYSSLEESLMIPFTITSITEA